MHAIVLAGGFGTRLQSVVSALPKPMAPIGNKPFLAYLLDYLKTQGIHEVTLSLHHLAETVQTYFGKHYNELKINYLIEHQPLGTGGAITYSLETIKPIEPIFVINGDTFVKLDFKAMYQAHLSQLATMSMALTKVSDCSRYGEVLINDKIVAAFHHAGTARPGFINAGVYLLNPTIFNYYVLEKQFSFERDFLYPHIERLQPHGFVTQDYFIDIGIPDDYARACRELPALPL